MEKKTKGGLQICTAHGARCEKYPDHPLLVEREIKATRVDIEFAEMVYGGRHSEIGLLVEAGYELPEEFTRDSEDASNARQVLFFETYDLDRHFPKEPPSPPKPCKPRKLTSEEIRERNQWAREAREAYAKGRPAPHGPWEDRDFERARAAMAKLEAEGHFKAWEAEQRLKTAERVKALAEDDELRQKLAGALTTWANKPSRHLGASWYTPKPWERQYLQDIREGYGDAVPDFEEME
ncbi:hypothetical protein [Streptomyces erythrochromogenes]|uniref:hypothetical protein n=1 Tax=Streptomyces erythrochromogenes TaxID=285574 RepID=UPI0036B98629